jgi:putative sigma-54 modulation protein
MDIRLQSLHFKASDNLQAFVNEKVSKLFNHNDKIVFADVTLYEDGSEPDNKYCEMKLAVPDNEHFVKKNSPSFEQSILETVEAMQKIQRREHTKITNQHNKPA